MKKKKPIHENMDVVGYQLINFQGNGENIKWSSSRNDYGHNNLWKQ